MNLGILALQGDVPEHRAALRALLADRSIVEVRDRAALAAVDGLLLPGGESTTMSKLLRQGGLFEPLRERLAGGLPVLATCAGLILLARELAPEAAGTVPATLGLLDVAVHRNDYGRQVDSFEAELRVPLAGPRPFPGVFIRAPRILRVGPSVEPIAFLGDQVVGVRTGSQWGLAFHPELSGDLRLHRAWLASWSASGPAGQRSISRSARMTQPAVPIATASQ